MSLFKGFSHRFEIFLLKMDVNNWDLDFFIKNASFELQCIGQLNFSAFHFFRPLTKPAKVIGFPIPLFAKTFYFSYF